MAANDGNSNATVDAEMKDGLRQKRKEFRDWLEATGTLDALTRGLVALYENPVKPENPVAFFMESLSLGVSMKAELEALKHDLTDTRERLAQALAENLELRSALAVRKSIGSGQGFEEPLLPEEKIPSEIKGQSQRSSLTSPHAAAPHH